jgi:hypothetical protein
MISMSLCTLGSYCTLFFYVACLFSADAKNNNQDCHAHPLHPSFETIVRYNALNKNDSTFQFPVNFYVTAEIKGLINSFFENIHKLPPIAIIKKDKGINNPATFSELISTCCTIEENHIKKCGARQQEYIRFIQKNFDNARATEHYKGLTSDICRKLWNTEEVLTIGPCKGLYMFIGHELHVQGKGVFIIDSTHDNQLVLSPAPPYNDPNIAETLTIMPLTISPEGNQIVFMPITNFKASPQSNSNKQPTILHVADIQYNHDTKNAPTIVNTFSLKINDYAISAIAILLDRIAIRENVQGKSIINFFSRENGNHMHTLDQDIPYIKAISLLYNKPGFLHARAQGRGSKQNESYHIIYNCLQYTPTKYCEQHTNNEVAFFSKYSLSRNGHCCTNRLSLIAPLNCTDILLVKSGMKLVEIFGKNNRNITHTSNSSDQYFNPTITIDDVSIAVTTLNSLKTETENPYYYLWATRFIYHNKLTNIFTFLHDAVHTYGPKTIETAHTGSFEKNKTQITHIQAYLNAKKRKNG